ncbi:hypothetical protein ABGB07_03225 [Micromonosporaceae bacterium B7E4]
MKDPAIRILLDTSAIIAYTKASISVGETIAEVVDEGGSFGASVLCLAEATRLVDPEHALGVPLLVRHPRCVVLPVLAEDWSAVAEWTRTLGRVDLAVSIVEAVDRNAYVLTAEPERYGDKGDGEVPVIPI